MAIFTISNVQLKGVATCVPENQEDNAEFELLSPAERDLFIKTIGIRYRRIVKNGETASDLCCRAATEILKKLDWQKNEIDILIFVSQTPDYLIPFTSCTLQHKLGLGKQCMAFDINLGCSGYVYGLSILASLLQNKPGSKGLLLVGDCSSSCISKLDKSVAPLFSDAGSASALEFTPGETMCFNLQTDGKEFDNIIIKHGGMKHPFVSDALMYHEIEKGQKRNGVQMKLDGMKIFNFALREVPSNIEALLQHAAIPKEAITMAYFHQANLLMNERVRGKIGLTVTTVPYTLFEFGNTSSASIPLTMCVKPSAEPNALLCGFGVGLSWGSAIVNLSNTTLLPILTY